MSRLRRSRRNVKHIAVWATERAVRRIAHWQLNNAINLSVWRNPDDTTPTITAIPNITFRIYGGTVRVAALETLKERLLPTNGSASQVIVVRPRQFFSESPK